MKNILVIDDNPTNLTLARETMQEKYKVSVVISGEQALRFLDKKPADLILLDIFMPDMDGLETLKKIKERPGFDTPVAVMTGLLEDETKEEFAKLGVSEFIQKPFIPSEMLVTVKKLIGE